MGTEIGTEQHEGIEVRVEIGELSGVEEWFLQLVEGLSDPNVRVRELAVRKLAASGHPRAVDHLIGALDDDRAEVRMRAASALGRLGDPVAVPHLIRAAKGLHPVLHWAAIAVLGSGGSPAR